MIFFTNNGEIKLTELLYLDDSYIKEFDAKVIDITDKGIVLDKTAFYPVGGGLPSDTGFIEYGNEKIRVNNVIKEAGEVYHVVERSDIPVGALVRGLIDWDRRYRIMRLHTAAHVLSGLLYSMTGALITGNAIRENRAHIDFSLEKTDRELFQRVIEKANKLISEGRQVKIYYMEREKVLQTPGMVKLAGRLPPNIPVLRIVEIEGIDIQPDGGVHVSNTKEIGEIELLKIQNKGKNRKRLHFTVKP